MKIEADGKTKIAVRITTKGSSGEQVKTWADAATKKPNQMLSNFIDNANNLRPTEYAPSTKLDGLKPVMTLTYKDEHGAELGTLSLYKHEKPGTLPEGQELDPSNPHLCRARQRVARMPHSRQQEIVADVPAG